MKGSVCPITQPYKTDPLLGALISISTSKVAIQLYVFKCLIQFYTSMILAEKSSCNVICLRDVDIGGKKAFIGVKCL